MTIKYDVSALAVRCSLWLQTLSSSGTCSTSERDAYAFDQRTGGCEAICFYFVYVCCVCVCVVVPLTQLQHSRIRTRKHSITINQFVLSRSDKIERQFYFHTRGSVGLNFRLEWLIQLVRMMCARPFSALPFANAKYTDNNNNNREGVVCW